MEHYIAMGFQNTVDFELKWDCSTVNSLIALHNIKNEDITGNISIQSERELITVLLSFMKSGTGGERFASSSDITRTFASHFAYEITLGGTPVRAAEAIGKLGYRCCLHACSNNRHFTRLAPPTATWITSVPDEGSDFHPHVILQFPEGAHIKANDIDFIIPRSNRAIFDHDPPSKNLVISEDFQTMVQDAKVFLAAGYNVIEDQVLLMKRLNSTIRIIRKLPEDCTVIYEDGDHEDLSIGRLTFQTLAPYLDVMSLNEDELQSYIGHSIDITNPAEVADAVRDMYRQANVPLLVCHSAYWALAYGKNPGRLKDALECAILIAATRFRIGNNFTSEDYEKTKEIPLRLSGIEFSKEITHRLGEDNILCLPGLDMDNVAQPVTIGLGDAFIGGLLLGVLTEEERDASKVSQ